MIHSPEIICIGQAVVDCITRGVEGDPLGLGKTRAESITLNLGGDAVNESFVLAGKGRMVRLVCAVGDDMAGRFVCGEAGRRGVLTDGITAVPGLVTPVADMFVKKDGSRSSVSSAAAMLPGYIPDAELLAGAGVVSFASLFRAPLDQAEVIRTLVSAAHESGAVICADTKLPTWRKLGLADLEDVLPMIDYIFPNEEEAAYYTGREDPAEMAEEFHRHGVRHVVIKEGSKGCFGSGKEGMFSIPARNVPVVDTTGAGDNFVAGFIDALLGGAGFRDCCEAGILMAADSVRHLGAVE